MVVGRVRILGFEEKLLVSQPALGFLEQTRFDPGPAASGAQRLPVSLEDEDALSMSRKM